MSVLTVAFCLFVANGPNTGAAVVMGRQSADYRLIRARSELELPSYQNNGFRQRVREEDETLRIAIEVDIARLRSSVPGRRVQGLPEEMAGLEARLNAAASGLLADQVAVLMSWLRSELRYHERAGKPQDVAAVLASGEGNCVGYSNLALFVLRQMGVSARYVTGVAFRRDDKVRRRLEGNVLHRWIEVHYEDVGWVFSDPAGKANFVEATYLVLGIDGAHPLSETLDLAVGSTVELARLRDGLRPVAVLTDLDGRLLVRPNQGLRAKR